MYIYICVSSVVEIIVTVSRGNAGAEPKMYRIYAATPSPVRFIYGICRCLLFRAKVFCKSNIYRLFVRLFVFYLYRADR